MISIPTTGTSFGGGTRAAAYKHVAAYLATLDLANFDAKAPPEKTPAFWTIVDANCAPEEGELADILDKLGNPDADHPLRYPGEEHW